MQEEINFECQHKDGYDEITVYDRDEAYHLKVCKTCKKELI